jgi:transposase InsO family protein
MLPVLISVLAALQGVVRSRVVLHLEVLALRHQLQVLQRSRPRRVRLAKADRWLWAWLSRSWGGWRTALVIVKDIKTVPYVPLSHPFVERLIGTIRRECLDHTIFWTAADLEMKLLDFQRYYNGHRAHAGLDGCTPDASVNASCAVASLSTYRWQRHCRELYETPIAA